MSEKELGSFLFEVKEKITFMDQEEHMAWLQCECVAVYEKEGGIDVWIWQKV